LKGANAPLLRAFSNTRSASRDSTAIDISRMVTGLVNVNGNRIRLVGGPGLFRQYFLFLSPASTSRASTWAYAEPRLPGLLSNLPRTDVSRGPIPIRLPVRRPTTSLPEPWRNNPRTSRNRDSVPRLWRRLLLRWLNSDSSWLSSNHSAPSKGAEYSAYSVLGSGARFSLSLGHITRPLTISRASGSRPLLPP
jgi:hypothetical protein